MLLLYSLAGQFKSVCGHLMLQEAQAALIRLRAANQQLQLELDSVRQADGASPTDITRPRSARSAGSPSNRAQRGLQGTSRPSLVIARSADESMADRRIRELEDAARESEQLISELQVRVAEAEYANPLYSGFGAPPSPPASSTADSSSVIHASELRHRQHSQPQPWSPRTAELQRQPSASSIKVWIAHLA